MYFYAVAGASPIHPHPKGKRVTSGGSKGGVRPLRPPAQHFFIFMQFLGKIGQIIGWRPPPSVWGWRPLLWGILDLPLVTVGKGRL